MKIWPHLLSPLVTAISSAAAEPVWTETDLQPLAISNRIWLASVWDAPTACCLQGFKPLKPIVINSPETMSVAVGITKSGDGQRLGGLSREPDPTLTIGWTGPQEPTGLHYSFSTTSGLVRSTGKIGTAGVTRTFFASAEDHAIFIHLISDKPGALTFCVNASAGFESRTGIENRRQIIAKTSLEGGYESRVWVLPFESDVTAEKETITVRGEGEALLIWTFGPTSDVAKQPDTLETLAARYDPGAKQPDWSKIWQGALATQMKSAANPH